MLPTAVNPELADGKFIGESKNEILNTIEKFLPEYAAKHCLINITSESNEQDVFKTTIEQLSQKGIHYPFVAKPDLGCRGAGVNLIHTPKDLESYIHSYPRNQAFICQALIPYEAEAGVFYCKKPWEKNGKIISLTLKSFPKVIGDGEHTLRDLITMDPRAGLLTDIYFPRFKNKLDLIPALDEKINLVFAGNHSKGAIFKDGRDLISQSLTQTFDQISKRVPHFYFGRFDIRYENFTNLEKGLGFKIVEINGACSESTHIWDANYTLLKAYKDLFYQFHLVFMIGDYNVKHGFKAQTIKDLLHSYSLDKKLSKLYPGTH
jgi:hypothetical protein